MIATLRTIQALAIGLCLLAPILAPIHAQAASPGLDERIIADAYVYLIGASMAGLAVLATGGCTTHVPGNVATTVFGAPGADVAG